MNLRMNAESTDEASPRQYLSELERELLDELCPAVDICDSDATTPKLRPNGEFRNGKISCCTGCSCHSDCGEMMNCCFSDEDIDPSIHQCRRTSSGQLDIDMTEPGYWTIVKAPQSGCADNTPIKIGPDQLVYPTCDDDIPLVLASTPVHSTGRDELYKNVLCARCHGVTKMTPFYPLLKCKKYSKTGESVSLAEQMTVFDTGILSRNCYLDISDADKSVISSKKCYPDVIDTCETNATTYNPTNIDSDKVGFEMIKFMCETGVYAPAPSRNKMYRNVFCAECALKRRRTAYCFTDDGRTADIKSIVHLMDDTKLMRQSNKNPDIIVPKVCLTSETPEVGERCRRRHCPSGQIRQTRGGCAFVSRSILGGEAMVQIKLAPIEPEDSILNANENIDNNLMKEAVISGQPWPNQWQVIRVHRRVSESQCTERGDFLLYLLTTAGSLQKQYQDMKMSIRKPWILEVNGSSFRFRQSFQEYTIESTKIWQKLQQNQTDRYLGCEAIKWSVVFYEHGATLIPAVLNKLFLCEQVELSPGEFTLGLKKAYLESNLTRRILYDIEFDLIMKDEYHARVCVHDTIFSREIHNAGIQPSSRICALAVALRILHVFI